MIYLNNYRGLRLKSSAHEKIRSGDVLDFRENKIPFFLFIRSLIAFLPIAFFAGCPQGTGFESSTRISDLRVLAIKLEPPEISLPLDADADPVDVHLTVLLANPEREPFSWMISSCPGAGSLGCRGWNPDYYRERGWEESFGNLASGRVDTLHDEEAPQTLLKASMSFSPGLMFELFEDASVEGLGGVRPAFEISAFSEERGENAFKRLQLSLPDIAYRLIMNELGISVCDEENPVEGCIEYLPKIPNNNPVIERIALKRIKGNNIDNNDDDIVEWEIKDDKPVHVKPGERIRFIPYAEEGSSESYQTMMINYEDHSVRVQDRDELLIWSWFSTAGSFSLARTEEERNLYEFNDWTAPREVEENMEIWIWIVLRDNRGGVDFTKINVRVENDEG